MLWKTGNLVDVPEGVRVALKPFFDDAVDHVRVIEYSLFARMHGRAIATTRRRSIYLRGSAEDFFSDPVLMLHEYCHVLHQWEPGALTTPRYVVECLRRGYWQNRFEIEARAFAENNHFRFRKLLKQHYML